MTVRADVAATIGRDIANGVTVEESRLTYTQEMRTLREELQRDWDVYRAEHPDAIMHIPE